jgi:hypothetical protein
MGRQITLIEMIKECEYEQENDTSSAQSIKQE